MTRRKAGGPSKRRRRPPPPKLKAQRSERSLTLKPPATPLPIVPENRHGEPPVWIDDQGVHAILPGERPDPQMLQRMSEAFQQKLRDSPMYQQLVDAHGPVKAEKIIQQCRAELR